MSWWPWGKNRSQLHYAARQKRWHEAEKVYREALQNYQTGQFQTAMAKFEQARGIAHELNETGPEAAALNDMGVCYAALK